MFGSGIKVRHSVLFPNSSARCREAEERCMEISRGIKGLRKGV